MTTKQSTPKDIDDYIARFPEDIQELLEKIRLTIKVAAPEAEERISYQMPTFALEGNQVHFAANKNHIGFYPTPAGIEEFEDELSPYIGGKGTVKFPFNKPIPYDLITKIVKYRAKENLERAETKGRKKKLLSDSIKTD